MTKEYDVIIIGGGAGGLFAAYEFVKKNSGLKVAILEKGLSLDKRKCPIDGEKITNCINCKSCSITNGIGGAGAFSDGKYNITNEFGGDLASYVGDKYALELMKYVDEINQSMGGDTAKLYSTADSGLKSEALKYDLHLLNASVRHLGTEKNYNILTKIVEYISAGCDIICGCEAVNISYENEKWNTFAKNGETYVSDILILATGRSGSGWTSSICEALGIKTRNSKVDIGIRFECPSEIWADITSKVYEAKISYRSPKTGCNCRTFCMNPNGYVVAENTNGLVTANGHSFASGEYDSENTNFALLVSHEFTEPFEDGNAYGEHIARLTNMLAGGVMVQRFGDLIANKRTNEKRLAESYTRPTLNATPGNLALAIPKMTLDTVIEMIYALDKLVPGTANYDNLLYGAEIKFYNSVVEVDGNLMTAKKNLYAIGDASGTTHSLSQASAEGVHAARCIMRKINEE